MCSIIPFVVQMLDTDHPGATREMVSYVSFKDYDHHDDHKSRYEYLMLQIITQNQIWLDIFMLNLGRSKS